jgi:hypothetical protein
VFIVTESERRILAACSALVAAGEAEWERPDATNGKQVAPLPPVDQIPLFEDAVS